MKSGEERDAAGDMSEIFTSQRGTDLKTLEMGQAGYGHQERLSWFQVGDDRGSTRVVVGVERSR